MGEDLDADEYDEDKVIITDTPLAYAIDLLPPSFLH